ncbi:MAG: metallophosphoesterase, partial [Kiritimatiellae bacterium]|nr:metallophosphoesterase [Kiritimatiellia bacterium]
MTFLISFIAFSFLTALVPSIFLLPRLELKRRTQVSLTVALFLISGRFLCSYVFAGSMFNPVWHPAVVFVWGMLDTALSILFFAQIPCYLFFRRLSVKWRRIVAALLVVMSVAATATGSYECMKIPQVKEITLCYKDLPSAFDGYRIAQLSDLHCSQITPRSRFEKIVQRTNEAKPDVICLTGDYVDGWVSQIGYKLEPLDGFRAPDGVFAIPGNHEYYWDWKDWRKFLAGRNIAVLENTWANIARGEDSLVVAG